MKHMLLVWFNPDHLKGDRHYTGYLCIHSTTKPLHQGAVTAGETRPEELLAIVECKVAGLILERAV